jgi:hypothetical protein
MRENSAKRGRTESIYIDLAVLRKPRMARGWRLTIITASHEA